MFSIFVMAAFIAIAAFLLIKGRITWTKQSGYSDVSEHSHSLRPYAAIPIVLLLLVAFFSFTTRVEAKQVGVLSTFGKPSDKTYGSGLAFHMPWQEMTQIDATTQTNEYHGGNALKVILADKNTADISVTIRWAVNPKNANDVYADFRSNDPTESLRKAVVSTQLKAALNTVFNGYDATAEKPATPDDLSKQVESILKTRTDELVNIKSITISYIKPDATVQKKIDQLQSQKAQTKVAAEKVLTADQEAQANRKLSESVSNDPNVLVSKCLDLIADGDLNPPAGFSCWPGQGGSVVIPSTK